MAAHAATIEVFPGPGTPLQDAISIAAAGDQIFIHAGLYTDPWWSIARCFYGLPMKGL